MQEHKIFIHILDDPYDNPSGCYTCTVWWQTISRYTTQITQRLEECNQTLRVQIILLHNKAITYQPF